MSVVEVAVKTLIRKQTKRDKQKRIGPSELGNPCDRCLGLRLAHRVPDGPRPRSIDQGGLKAWLGTAVHFYLKHLGDKDKHFREMTHREFTVPVAKLKGYGKVKGHCDLLYADGWAVEILDYKTSDLVRIKKYRSLGVPREYRAQAHLYGYGVNAHMNVGAVQRVSLLFIPRDSNNFDDIWYWSEPYDPQVALDAIAHAEWVFKQVKKGRLEHLQSDSECFDCNDMYRDVTFSK